MGKLACGTIPRDATAGANQTISEHEERELKRKKYRSLAAMALEFAHQAAARGEWVAALELANGAIFDILEADKAGDGECAAALPRIVDRFRTNYPQELATAREALDQLLGAVQNYIPAAQVDLGHPAANRLALAQLRAYDVLYPGTTRHG